MSESSSSVKAPTTGESEKSLDDVLSQVLIALDAGDVAAVARAAELYPQHAERIQRFLDEMRQLRVELEASRVPPAENSAATLRGDTRRLLEDPPQRSTDEFYDDGLLIDGYHLLSELGTGGMGVVFRAYQPRLNRTVALKLSRRLVGYTHEDVARLQFESQAAGSLDHPHIVPIYDSGEVRGRYFIAMKLIAGCSLKELPQGTQSEEIARLVLVIQAVEHAHDRGILHRDLKPSNILIDSQGVPYVADFGLAKRLDSHDGLTQTGTRLGTPQYMSPEQAMGQRILSIRSDIYSLGAILYERLVGTRWVEERVAADGLAHSRTQRVQKLYDLSATCDRSLQTILTKCLEHDPQDRYANCRELSADLERWLRGESISTRRLNNFERSLRWMWRHPKRAFLAVAVTLFAIFAMGLFVVHLQTRRLWQVTQYGQQIERARAEILERHPGWSGRTQAAIAKAAPLIDSEDQRLDLNDLRVSSLIGLDISPAVHTVPLENTRVVRFHPTRPWLFVAQKHADKTLLDAPILVVDTGSGEVVRRFSIADAQSPDQNGVTDMAFTADGRWLLVVTRASNLLAFDVSAPANLSAHSVSIDGLKLIDIAVFSEQQTLVMRGVTASGSGYLGSISLETWSSQSERIVEGGISDAIAANDIGCLLLCSPNQIEFVDPLTLATIKKEPIQSAGNLAYHNGWIAVYGRSQITIYDAHRGTTLGVFASPPSGFPLTSWDAPIAFTHDGLFLVLADNERNQIHFWSTTDLQYLQSTAVIDSQFNNITFDVSSDFLLAASGGGQTSIMNIRPSLLRPVLRGSYPLRAVALSKDEGTFATLRETQISAGLMNVYDIKDRQEVEKLEIVEKSEFAFPGLPDYHSCLLDLSTDGSQIAALSHEPRFTPRVKRFTLEGDLRFTSPPLAGFRGFAFDAPDAICAATVPGLVRWNSDLPKTPWAWAHKDHREADRGSDKFCLILPIGDQRIILGDEVGRLLCLRQADAGTPQFDIQLSDVPIRAAAFHAATAMLAVGDGRGRIFLVDMQPAAAQRPPFVAHWSGVTALDWTKCGHLISAGLDQNIRYWSLDATQQPPRCNLKLRLRSNVRRLFADVKLERADSAHELVIFREGTFALELLRLDRGLLGQ